MRSAVFLSQQWPMRHEHLVEECVAAGGVLHVNDVLPLLTGWHRAVISRWSPPTYPHLTLVAQMGGPFRRWWLVCPGCKGRCDALYTPPNVSHEDWRCRRCQGFIYASQRYGFRHPLRKVLTHRKRISGQREVMRQERRWARRASDSASGSLDPEEREAIDWAEAFRATLTTQSASRAKESRS